jgi:hypothetical protein
MYFLIFATMILGVLFMTGVIDIRQEETPTGQEIVDNSDKTDDTKTDDSKNSNGNTNTVNNGNGNTTANTGNTVDTYTITYQTFGKGNNASVLFDCSKNNEAYEEANFTIQLVSEDYVISGVKLAYDGAEENDYLEGLNGKYTFEMPPADVVVNIYLGNSYVPSEKAVYLYYALKGSIEEIPDGTPENEVGFKLGWIILYALYTTPEERSNKYIQELVTINGDVFGSMTKDEALAKLDELSEIFEGIYDE